MSDLQELSVYAVFSIIVISKVLDFLKSRTLSPEQQAQNEFYKSYAHFLHEWRVAGEDIETLLEIQALERTERKLNHQEIINMLDGLVYKGTTPN